jgi:hypothetical protein
MRIVLAVVLALAIAGCGGRLFRQYEYEEEMYLSLDGSATVYVNSSVPALNALRGSSFDPRPNARLDRAAVREFFTTAVTRDVLVTASRRDNRQFVHVRLEVDDVTRLGEASPFAWSSYRFSNDGSEVGYRQSVGTVDKSERIQSAPAWKGDEFVAFRLHLPSRIVFHNAGEGNLQRGNILVWEQPLSDRLNGTPLTLEARMEPQSILYSTLLLFGATLIGVATLFALAIWLIMRRGRGAARAGTAGGAGMAGG